MNPQQCIFIKFACSKFIFQISQFYNFIVNIGERSNKYKVQKFLEICLWNTLLANRKTAKFDFPIMWQIPPSKIFARPNLSEKGRQSWLWLRELWFVCQLSSLCCFVEFLLFIVMSIFQIRNFWVVSREISNRKKLDVILVLWFWWILWLNISSTFVFFLLSYWWVIYFSKLWTTNSIDSK